MAKILVTGATGNTCSILIPELIRAGQEVRAFVRNEEKAQSLISRRPTQTTADIISPPALLETQSPQSFY